MPMRIVVFALSIAALMAGPALAQSVHTHQHSFGDADEWSKIFDDPQRDVWQKPHQVIQALALKPDAVVVDLGAGTGYFAMRLAHMLPQGRVYAVDTEVAMLKHVAERAQRANLRNVVAVEGSANDPRTPAKADLILLVDVYHHIGNREHYFANLAAALKPGGRIAIVDFRLDSPHGPPAAARVEPGRVKTEMAKARYELTAEHGFLPYQYFLVFERR